MTRRASGFTLVELLFTMAILSFVLVGASQMFVALLGTFKQQGKIAETNIEGIIGLELLRQDLNSAGYGLPWSIPPGATYQEAAVGYNDSPSSAPRAFVSDDNAGLYGSDILVVKAVNIARNDPCKKWTYLSAGNVLHPWGAAAETLAATDQVIVIDPGATDATRRTLVADAGSNWKTTFNNTASYAPDSSTIRFVYGVSGPIATNPTVRMPFNRADYYITDAPSYRPTRCAPNTGVLVKSVISHSTVGNGPRSDTMPLLDCVADMQVVFKLSSSDTTTTTISDSAVLNDPLLGTALSAQQIRDQLRQVVVYILAHEGQQDSTYTYSNPTIQVGPVGLGQLVDVSTRLNYRWKVYTLSIRPYNLR